MLFIFKPENSFVLIFLARTVGLRPYLSSRSVYTCAVSTYVLASRVFICMNDLVTAKRERSTPSGKRVQLPQIVRAKQLSTLKRSDRYRDVTRQCVLFKREARLNMSDNISLNLKPRQ